jgi:hypothetical protein
MGEGNDAPVDFAGQLSEARLYELADLPTVVLVTAEGVGNGVDNDELCAEVARLAQKFVEKSVVVPCPPSKIISRLSSPKRGSQRVSIKSANSQP